jgi:hypothetical protein
MTYFLCFSGEICKLAISLSSCALGQTPLQGSKLPPEMLLKTFKVCHITMLFSKDAVKLSHEYMDRIYIRKDIVLKLTEYGVLNQTTLLSYTGLNLAKHRNTRRHGTKRNY